MRVFTHTRTHGANHTELAAREKQAEEQLCSSGGTLGFYKDGALLLFSSSLSSPAALFSHFQRWGISSMRLTCS